MQRRRLAPPPVPAGPDLSSPIHPSPHFRSNLKAFAVIGQSLLLRCLLGVPGLSGQRRVRGPLDAYRSDRQKLNASCGVEERRLRSIFSMLGSPPRAAEREALGAGICFLGRPL